MQHIELKIDTIANAFSAINNSYASIILYFFSFLKKYAKIRHAKTTQLSTDLIRSKRAVNRFNERVD